MTHRAEQFQRLRLGLVCAAGMAGLGALIDGLPGAFSAGVLSLVATLMQIVAARVMWRTGVTPSVDHLRVYALGVFLRFTGVAVLAVLIARFPQRFAIVPSVVGYLGTVLPLLYLETRLGR